MKKEDLWNECYDRQVSPEEFKQVFCDRCRNIRCVNAGWAHDMFGKRVESQMDRLFNTKTADPNDPRFQHLTEVDFPSLLNEAIRLNIADQRGDWSLPETPEMKVVLSPIEGEPACDESQQHVEEAVKNLTGTQGEQVEVSDSDTPKNTSQKPDKKTQKSLPKAAKSLKPQHFHDEKNESTAPEPPVNQTVSSSLKNTDVPDEGLMIGGEPVPNKVQEPKPESDPWAPKKEKILKPGATVSMGVKKK